MFSCFALPDTFSAVQRASGPVFMFCAPRLVFGGAGGVRSHYHFLCARTHFRRAVPRATGPDFMFCVLGLVFGGTEGVGSRFHVLRSLTRFRLFRGHRVPFLSFAPQTHFRKYRGRPVPFSCFALPDIFSVVPSASCPILMFCAPGLIFGGIEGVQSHFHVLRSQIYFRWCRVRRCATLFCALRTAAGGDGMQKKDTEIPPERAFV
jgi:hypothetical protein